MALIKLKWLALTDPFPGLPQVMEDAALIPVEERIHIENLRLLIVNAKLRKIVIDSSEGVLSNSLAKVDRRRCLYSVRFDIFCDQNSEDWPSIVQPIRACGFVQWVFIGNTCLRVGDSRLESRVLSKEVEGHVVS
jgi:hypothetical protein